MFTVFWKGQRMALMASLIVMLLLTACGGDDEGESSSTNSNSSSGSSSGSGAGAALVCFALILTSGDDGCLEAAVSGTSSGSSSSGATGGDFSIGMDDSHSLDLSVQYVVNREIEPNDDRSVANPLTILTTTAPDGFFAEGHVNDASDLADAYTFARPNSRHFRIVLCSDGSAICNSQGEIDTLTAYIDVLDSSGNLLVSSYGATRNMVEPMIHAGPPYFVKVIAGDTMGATVAYDLIAHEFE